MPQASRRNSRPAEASSDRSAGHPAEGAANALRNGQEGGQESEPGMQDDLAPTHPSDQARGSVGAGEPGAPGDPAPADASDQADRFGRARVARSTVLAEDYVELIAELRACEGEARAVDIARRQGVSHASVIKTLGRLRREGLVSGRPYRGLFLTEAGQALAERVRARHRVVVALLVAVGVPPADAEADAEGIEHHVSAATLRAFSRFLGGA